MLNVSMLCNTCRVATTVPAPAQDVDEFLAAFDGFAQAVRRARGAPAGPGSLTLSQYGLLEPLQHEASARVRELAARAGVAAPTATRMLDTLQRRGLVQRRQTAGDRRGVTVRLTERGRTMLAAQHEWIQSRQRALYASLPIEERRLIPDVLVRLGELIDELAAGPGG